jgi:hypothetical protein
LNQVADVLVDNVYLEDYSLLKAHEYSACLYHTKGDQSWQGVRYSGVKVTIWLRRKYMHELVNIALAQCLTTSFVFAVWAIPKEEIANRLSCDFALVLAAVAMKFVVNQTLPPVAYVTLLEQYVTTTFCFLGACTAAHACTESLSELITDCSEGVCSDTVDRSVLSAFATCGALVNVCFAWHMRAVSRQQVQRVLDMNLSTGPEEHAVVRVQDENGQLSSMVDQLSSKLAILNPIAKHDDAIE